MAEKRITQRDLLEAATKISDATNALKDSKENFARIENKFNDRINKIFFILENDDKTGSLGVVNRVADLEKWRTEIDFLLANLKGQVMGYTAAGVVILYFLGKLAEWAIKFIPKTL